jgi:hypothetical protein
MAIIPLTKFNTVAYSGCSLTIVAMQVNISLCNLASQLKTSLVFFKFSFVCSSTFFKGLIAVLGIL